MMITIVDYGLGNLGSIRNMLKRIGYDSTISSRPEDLIAADHLILPGVGAFDSGMTSLRERNLIGILNEEVLNKKKPILGICLGMQIITRYSEEGTQPGLGWLNAETRRFDHRAVNGTYKTPHMGWNTITIRESSVLFNGMMEQENRFYFVHSYHVQCADETNVIAETEYGYMFPSIIGSGNIFATQFHPEKSHRFGMQLLKNFVELT